MALSDTGSESSAEGAEAFEPADLVSKKPSALPDIYEYVVDAGPPDFLNRTGVERAQSWLGEETGSMEVRGGDYPLPGEDEVAGAVLLSGVKTVPRIEELNNRAAKASRSVDRGSSRDADAVDGLRDGGLDPLF